MNIYKQTRTRPCFKNGKTVFNLQKKPGVYLIYRREEIVYIGFSGYNLYKTMYRHFQTWNHKNQIVVTYSRSPEITVRVVYTNTALRAQKLEKALILKHKPKDNPNKYEQYTLTPKDEENLKAYADEPINDIIRGESDYPF